MGLLDSVKGVVTNAVVDKAADALGIESGMAKSAIKMFLPAIIGGVINKGSTESGAGGLIDLFKKGGFGDDNLGDLMGVLGDNDKRSGWLETGSDLLGSVFGNNQSGILDMLLKATGISKGGGSSLLSFLAPIVINKLAGMVFGKGMNAAGLSSYLGDQREEVMGLVPGMSSLFGAGASASEAVGTARTASSSHSSSSSDSSDGGGGGGMLKWLLPLLLGALALWYFTKDGCNKAAEEEGTKTEESTSMSDGSDANTKTTASTNTETSSEGDTKAASEDGSAKTVDMTGYTFNDNNDIVNASGGVAYASGSYNIDRNGNLVDANGRIIAPLASLSSDFSSRLQAIMDDINLLKMKAMFSDMIVKKAGASNSYALSKIEFNKEDHRISDFSKAEVIGLAEALKANVKGKIEVHVHTADGADKKENEKLSDTRANVIRDMLVTLGVDKGQIKAVGKGMADEAKASMGKVDIVIN